MAKQNSIYPSSNITMKYTKDPLWILYFLYNEHMRYGKDKNGRYKK